MDMPDNIDDMTMKEVKTWVAKEQEKIDFKKQAIQKLCWDEIGEVCKKYNCRIKPVVKLNEMEDGQCTFYADLVVVSGELDEESNNGESNGEDKSDDKESSDKSDDALKEEGHESPSSEDNKV